VLHSPFCACASEQGTYAGEILQVDKRGHAHQSVGTGYRVGRTAPVSLVRGRVACWLHACTQLREPCSENACFTWPQKRGREPDEDGDEEERVPKRPLQELLVGATTTSLTSQFQTFRTGMH
jgi:hypothetical protein